MYSSRWLHLHPFSPPAEPFGLLDARSDKRRTIRVTFTEPPLARNVAVSDDALNPSNWTVYPTAPTSDDKVAYTTVEVTKIHRVKGNTLQLDIEVDLDFSFGVIYNVEMSSAISPANSPIGLSGNGNLVLPFDGFDPACRNKSVPNVFTWFGAAVRRMDYSGDAEKVCAVIQDLFEQIKSLIDCMDDQIDPLYCTEEFLDSRLRSLGNPFTNFTNGMTLSGKRRVAMKLVEIYRYKGTVYGIQLAIREILGFSGLYVNPLPENEWALQNETSELAADVDGEIFFLGQDIYDPTGSISGYPVFPIDEHWVPYHVYVGNCALGAGHPERFQAILSGEDGDDNDDHHAIVFGSWSLRGDSVPALPFEPDPGFDENTIVPEPHARESNEYCISSLETLTAEQVLHIRTVAEYMQPANSRLIEVRQPPAEYDPVVLGESYLNFDFELHG